MTDKPDLEARLAALEARNRDLEAEVSRLRHAAPPAPREEPRHRMLPGQAGLFDRNGNRVYLPGHETPSPASTTVGASSSFGAYRRDPDGTRHYMPDGVKRDPATGEVVTSGSVEPALPTGPVRTPAHQQNIDLVDRMFPVMPRTNKDD